MKWHGVCSRKSLAGGGEGSLGVRRHPRFNRNAGHLAGVFASLDVPFTFGRAEAGRRLAAGPLPGFLFLCRRSLVRSFSSLRRFD